MFVVVQQRPALAMVVMLVLCALSSVPVAAQAVSEEEVKAAYLYNFAKFIEWPQQDFASPTAPIRVCVLSGSGLQRHLEHMSSDKVVSGRKLMVTAIGSPEEARRCQMLFVGRAQKGLSQLMSVVKDSHVVTVGESDGFVQSGGVIEFVMDDNRVHFEINHRAATQAGLHISSRLLAVAKLVIE